MIKDYNKDFFLFLFKSFDTWKYDMVRISSFLRRKKIPQLYSEFQTKQINTIMHRCWYFHGGKRKM